MRLTFAHERLLAVMAHPDDAELLCAGTLARAAADGAAVGIAILCRGDRGAARDASPGQDLGALRHEEAASAAGLLGAQFLELGISDGELFDVADTRRGVIEIFRQFRPTWVIAHSPLDYHADHRAASAIAEAASWFCASRGHVTESPALECPPALCLADTIGMSGFSPHFFIDITDQMQLKRRMLACHRSQLQRGADGDFAPLEAMMLRQAEARGAQSAAAHAEAFQWHQAFKRARAF